VEVRGEFSYRIQKVVILLRHQLRLEAMPYTPFPFTRSAALIVAVLVVFAAGTEITLCAEQLRSRVECSWAVGKRRWLALGRDLGGAPVEAVERMRVSIMSRRRAGAWSCI